ncbi:flavin reductase family protein [Calidifontibacillus erzurumensis]|uniref:Flavin reductase n=1 Tax=Calidifontibacillus erzurumensis TaxID=2741433 RepID=A0A8J8GDW1_9BACI|nr:flavin reductase family protein [Calidifontibacillus erzurumensis]NSL50598.1 flavin reductase [Calidifontibacillus erzurumensis]
MDDRLFRNAMGKFATGVTVITTKVDEHIHGMTANAFMSVSLNPRLVAISISEKAKMLEKINNSKRFVVNILSNEQKNLSMHFAGQLIEGVSVEFETIDDMPVIKNALANIICNVKSAYVEGDHTVFIGEVTELKLTDGEPLAFFEGKYGKVVKD